MPKSSFNLRLLANTRSQILDLLRRSERTVDELAEALQMSGNGVRAHLAAMERDGFVEQRGVRRSERKPASMYRLTEQAERLFPKAHEEVLQHLLDILAEVNDKGTLEELIRGVGRRMAAGRPKPQGDMHARLKTAAAMLAELGGLSEIEETADGYSICGYSCPLAPLVRDYPELCKVSEAILTELLGVPVKERCERSELLWCSFDIPAVQL